MLFCGYISKKLKQGQVELAEASVAAHPDELRKLANFINECADKIDSDPTFDHLHFKDKHGHGEHTSDFIVLNPKFALKE